MDYVKDNYPRLKPNIGMIEDMARHLNNEISNCNVYMIGDRLNDVQMGLNAGGKGILTPSLKTRELGDMESVEKLCETYRDRIYIANKTDLPPFQEAAEFIIRDSK